MKSNALEIVTICGVFLVPEKERNMSEIRFSSKEHEKFFYQMFDFNILNGLGSIARKNLLYRFRSTQYYGVLSRKLNPVKYKCYAHFLVTQAPLYKLPRFTILTYLHIQQALHCQSPPLYRYTLL